MQQLALGALRDLAELLKGYLLVHDHRQVAAHLRELGQLAGGELGFVLGAQPVPVQLGVEHGLAHVEAPQHGGGHGAQVRDGLLLRREREAAGQVLVRHRLRAGLGVAQAGQHLLHGAGQVVKGGFS